VLCFSALSSGLTPPPQTIRPPNAAAEHQFVGAQLYCSRTPNAGGRAGAISSASGDLALSAAVQTDRLRAIAAS